MADIWVRVGQENAVKVIASVSGSAGGKSISAETSDNVIGGIASVTSLNVSGVSTFVGITTFKNNVYIEGNFFVTNDLVFDESTARNATVTGLTSTTNLYVGFATVTNAFYYRPSYTSGVAYFNSSSLMVSTGATSSSIDYTNYIITTDNADIPTWSNVIDGGVY